jgi:hypothetical protein
MAGTLREITTLARMNIFFAGAMEALPDYIGSVALHARAQQVRADLPAVDDPVPPDSADADFAGWLAAIAETVAAKCARTEQIEALTKLVDRCESAVQMCLLTNADRVLGSLAKDLDKLMRQVDAAVQRLQGARTPAEAIAREAADAWRELSDLRRSYDDLRTAQQGVMAVHPAHVQASRTTYWDDELTSDTQIANLDTVFPRWRQPQLSNLDRSPIDSRPWPLGDDVAELVWLSDSAAEPWIPRLAELDRLQRDRREAANPNPKQVAGLVPAPINSTKNLRRPAYETR